MKSPLPIYLAVGLLLGALAYVGGPGTQLTLGVNLAGVLWGVWRAGRPDGEASC